MISDDNFFKLSAQVQAIEMVLKTMLAMQFVTGVKDQAGISKAAEQTQSLKNHLLDHLRATAQRAPAAAKESGIADLITTEMVSCVSRMCDQASEQIDTVAKLVLAVSDAPSPARN